MHIHYAVVFSYKNTILLQKTSSLLSTQDGQDSINEQLFKVLFYPQCLICGLKPYLHCIGQTLHRNQNY